MAATDKPLRDQRTLDIVFAVSNILMLLSVVWMMYQDYAREYKDEQRAFREVEAAIAQRTALEQLPSPEEFKKAEDKVKEEREKRDSEANRKTVVDARTELMRLQPQKERAEAAYQSVKADVDSITSFISIAREHNDIEAATKYRNQLDELNSKLAEKQAARDAIVTDMKKQQLIIEEKEGPYTKAAAEFKKVADKLDTQVKLALTKRWTIYDSIRNIPVIDGFAAPVKIHQFTIKDIPIDYNFMYVVRFDRCMSCHVGIDRPTYTQENLAALKTDASQKNLDDAIALYKRRVEALDPKDTATIPNPGNISLVKLSDRTLSPARVREFAAHPRLDLFVGANSKHPAEKFGCSSCHYGQGSGTSFLDSSHSPNDSTTREAWTKNKHWEPNHMWDFPMLPTRFVEASCIKCHHEVTDLISSDNRVEAPKVIRGYNLIKENGCFGCHEISGWKSGNRIGPDLRLEPSPPLEDMNPIERNRVINDPDNRPGNLRKVGPALTRIIEKTTPQWIEKWLYSPSSFRPDTKMPHYYNLSTNGKDTLESEDARRKEGDLKQGKFPNTEIASIAHFLTKTSKDYLASAEEQRQKDAKDAGAKTQDETRLIDLLNRGRLNEDEQKEMAAIKFRIKLRRETKLVDLAPGHKADKEAIERGKKLFIERGCLACHTHQGTEGDKGVMSEAVFGPNLSQVPAKFGKSPEARKWLIQWIINPQVYSPRSRMPQTHLEPNDAADVAAWLLNQEAKDLGSEWPKIEIKSPERKELEELARVYLTRMLSKNDVELFFKGLSKDDVAKLKAKTLNNPAVTVMLNDVTDEEKKLFEDVTDDNALKYYLGKKAVNRLGCFGCHDIPGFEATKSIGVGLNDWGKKPADRLAFEDIGNFFKDHYYAVDSLVDKNGKPAHGVKTEKIKKDGKDVEVKLEPYEQFFKEVLLGHNPERMGYLNQKIRDPRSYDFNRIRTWDDRARMPKFTFARPRRHKDEADADFEKRILVDEAAAREAVATFILGLVAEQVPAKMTNSQMTPDRAAEVKGRQILDKYNCAGCHLIRPGVYDFKVSGKTLDKLHQTADDQGLLIKQTGEIVFPNHINWVGRNAPDAERLTAYASSLEFFPIPNANDVPEPWLNFRLSEALRFRDKNRKVVNIPSSAGFFVAAEDIAGGAKIKSQADADRLLSDSKPFGGAFADLLVPYLNKLDPEQYKPDGSAARTALPPSLIGQGERTRAEWLEKFLLDPHKVRRLSILRMPKFNMSNDEAKALTDYFAGVTRQTNVGIGLRYPFELIPQQSEVDTAYWTNKTAEYVKRLKNSPAIDMDGKEIKGTTAYQQRVAEYKAVWEKLSQTQNKSVEDLEKAWAEKDAYAADAYRLVQSRKLCTQCHQVGNTVASEKKKEGPPLAAAHDRLRPDWITRWVDKPHRFLPYDSVMIQNFSEREPRWQAIFRGPAIEQIHAARDVLLNYPRLAAMPINQAYDPDATSREKMSWAME